MIEKRKFPRVRLTTKSMLRNKDADYKGQLENISISGALVRLEQCIVVPLGGEYNLTIYIEGQDVPIRIIVEVVCSTLSLAGIKFVSCGPDSRSRLEQLVRTLTPESESMETKRETIRLHLDNYLR